MNITMLGTGNAMVTECYNTCFVLQDGEKHLLVDGGGGNTLLRQLKQAGFDWKDMREIFVTHKHVDHLMGIIWMIRMICQHMRQGAYAKDSTWLLHEAFCLHGQADIFHPYEKHHSTVKDACELTEQLHVKNLLLYHTEDRNLAKRKELYTEEGKRYYHGNLYVPDDLEKLSL